MAAEGTNGEGAGADAGATGGDAGDAGDAAAAAAADGAWASVEDEHNREEQPEQWRDGIRGNIYLRQLKLASYTSPEGMTQLGNAFWYGIKDTINPNRTAAEQCWLNAVADHDFAEAHFNLGYLWVTSQAADAKNFTLSERLETGILGLGLILTAFLGLFCARCDQPQKLHVNLGVCRVDMLVRAPTAVFVATFRRRRQDALAKLRASGAVCADRRRLLRGRARGPGRRRDPGVVVPPGWASRDGRG